MTYEDYKKLLKEKLTEQRYYHSLCVADEAERLAKKYGADSEKAYLAGLLHDITKNASKEEHFKIFAECDVKIDSITAVTHKLWHAVSGAAYVENTLGIKDAEILSAIRYHTTARSQMPLLDKILYLADFTSLDRDYDDVDVMREKVDISMDDALRYALSYTINELVGKQSQIHPDTFAAYNEVIKGERL